MPGGFDQEILQDFLTESGELLTQLEGDLVVLESKPRDPEMLNQVFRALHTIKGSASFLQLTNLVRCAHASESALNAARNGAIVVNAQVMNLLLEAVDVLKTQMGQVERGEDLVEARADLLAQLTAIGEGKQLGEVAAVAGASAVQAAAPDAAPPQAAPMAQPTFEKTAARKMELGAGKADLLEYLVADLDESMNKVRKCLDQLAGGGDVKSSSSSLAETCEALSRCVDFFEFAQMGELTQAMSQAASSIGQREATLSRALPILKDVCGLVMLQAEGIKAGELREVAASDLLDKLQDALSAPAGAPAPAPTPASAPVTTPEAASSAPAPPAGPSASPKSDEGGEKKAAASAVENTIRVEVGRLETLMNLVGELVLQKNRISALTRKVTGCDIDTELSESISTASNNLDRVTSDIQVAVMRTRMQPLDKLFGRYPRLIRDLAGKTGKKIHLNIEGGETEVDKSVIEELGDPLIHLIRNSCDHGLEGPEERAKAGKPETGTITLRARHEGSHVKVLIIDDGRGLAREKIGKKAVERGLVTQEQLAQLSDRDVWNFIFEAGFSTAEKVSDLSGRGVGMDVVRTNIQKLKGSVELFSEVGKGTTITITIPLTVAILPAMMVAVGHEIYALPLASILEIVRPPSDQISSIGGHPVVRLRDSVLPLINAADLFEQPEDMRQESPFAVILQSGDRRVGLMVSRLIGQQEVVIKPLDEGQRRAKRAVSGATVRDDGGVSLIVDVTELVKMAQGMEARPLGGAEQ